ncbi:MAG: M28 family peptidase [Candidatus Zixiibacteriota bacterium]
MKKSLITTILLSIVAISASADDLYKVTLHGRTDALALERLKVEPIMAVFGGYLVLADESLSKKLESSSLDFQLIKSSISCDQLAMDGRQDSKNTERFEVIYEEGRIRLLKVDFDQLMADRIRAEVFPIRQRPIKIEYHPVLAQELSPIATTTLESGELEDLMALIEQDTLESYVGRLEAFYRRLAGTDSNYAARDWIASKFAEFGYDSITIDPFLGQQLWDRHWVQCYNVIATKVGSKYPDKQIVIGGHFDAVPDCPGADDNASGTATVLEIARVLKNIETDMTIIFIGFDAEESWMWGSYHYVDEAVARGDDIVLMINPDMVAHKTNTDAANLYYGVEQGYAELWDQLANTYMGIDAALAGSTASDHLPFQEAGFDVIFVQEGIFSTNYHQSDDSTVHLNFEYMTRMVKTTLATLYVTDQSPPPVDNATLYEPGDGQSQMIAWQPSTVSELDHYSVYYYPTSNQGDMHQINIPSSDTAYTVNGLTEGIEYCFWVAAVDGDGMSSIGNDKLYGTPSSLPGTPHDLLALPVRDGIRFTWNYGYLELDFARFDIIRDGAIIDQAFAEEYIDDDPSLGSEFHSYHVVAVDNDDNHSDTVGIAPVWMKAATLDPGRILAVNRTSVHNLDYVDEVETGVFLREALDGYDFAYYSDTVATTVPDIPDTLQLIDMVDYGIMIIGADAGRYDDIGGDPEWRGILDTIAYYASIGGKVVVFGRWGTKTVLDTIDYQTTSATFDDAYRDFFHIERRVLTPTIQPTTYSLVSDLVGAHSQQTGYPTLEWDSLATLSHTNSNSYTFFTDVAGIPCATFVDLVPGEAEVIYTYDSRDNSIYTEGFPVAWRYLGDDYQYVYFDIPLSFFDRSDAIAALRKAVDELLAWSTPVEEITGFDDLPGAYTLSQNYPNPFNPATEIAYSIPEKAHVTLSVYNILGQKVTTLVDEEKTAGTHHVQWNGTNEKGVMAATGIYLYKMEAGRYKDSKKMLLLK